MRLTQPKGAGSGLGSDDAKDHVPSVCTLALMAGREGVRKGDSAKTRVDGPPPETSHHPQPSPASPWPHFLATCGCSCPQPASTARCTPQCSHTLTHIRPHTRTQISLCAHSHVSTLPHTHMCPRSALTHPYLHTPTPSQTHSHMCTHTCTHTPHNHTCACIPAHTHTHLQGTLTIGSS